MLWVLLAIIMGVLGILAEVLRDLQPRIEALHRDRNRERQKLESYLQEQQRVQQAIAAAQERLASAEKDRKVAELEVAAQRHLLVQCEAKEQRRNPTRYKVADEAAGDTKKRR
jgi:Tfp pilus assembly protein PilX